MSNDERPDSLAAQAAAWVPPWERQQREPDRAYQAAAEEAARLAEQETDEEPEPADLGEAAEAEEVGTGSGTAEEPSAGFAAAEDQVDGEGPAQERDEPAAEVAPAWDEPGTDVMAEGGESVAEAVREPEGDADRPEAGLDVAEAAEDGVPVEERGTAARATTSALPEAVEERETAARATTSALPEGAEEPISVDAPHADDPEREPTDVRSGPELPLPGAVEEAADEPVEDESASPVDAPLPPEGNDAGDVFDVAADDGVSDGDEVDLPFAEEEVTGAEATSAADGAASVGGVVPVAKTTPVAGAEPVAEAGSVAGAEPDAEAGLGAGSGPVGEAGSGAGGEAVVGVTPVVGAASAVASGSGEGGAEGRAAVPVQGRGVRNGHVAVDDVAGRTEAGVDLPALLDDAEFAAALEAILLVVDEPVAEMQLAQILEQPTERVAAALEDISARYTAAGHGFDLRRAAGGWRLYTRPEYAAYVERFVLDGQSVRLTQAALETLAVVAYKQPVTRSRISAIRGVNCDGVMRTLVTRGLIEECGTESETGAYLYRTTALFLEKLGLNSVEQLPPLAPFLPDDVEEVLDASG